MEFFWWKNIIQAISVYVAMKTETEWNNEALSEHCLGRNEIFSPTVLHIQQLLGHLQKKSGSFSIKQIETLYPVTAKHNKSISKKTVRAVTDQSLMANLKHLSADYDQCDGLYAATVGMNTNTKQ